MSDERIPAFDPDTQPTLLKLARRLAALRRIKAAQTDQQRMLNHQFGQLATKTAALFRDRGEARNMHAALRMATELAFEKIIENTIRFALTEPPKAQQTVELRILLVSADRHVVSTVQAPVGENGWLTCKVPVGQNYDTALLLGRNYAWCQMGEIFRLTEETDTQAKLERYQSGDVLLDQMQRRAENIFELTEDALIHLPASPSHGDRGSVIVQLRPLIMRETPRITRH